MSIHQQRAIETLNQKILLLGTRVEENVRLAVRSIEQHDAELAGQAIDNDDEIDDMEVDVEEECLKILALYQPVAADLRLIVATLKINNDLERVGDLAVNVAERALYLASQPRVEVAFDFNRMGECAQAMLANSLDALVRGDANLARRVCAADDEVDAMNRKVYIRVQDAIRKSPEHLETLIHLLSVSRHLERIADLATNIAEDVIYMREGEIVRHHIEDYLKKPDTTRNAPDPN